MIKLNFGCGLVLAPGWVHVDKLDHGQPEAYKLDILKDWPFNDDFFDIAVANHVMHMFNWKELDTALQQLCRTLKPGGVLRILDMNPVMAFGYYKRQNKHRLIIPDEAEESLDGKFCQYLTWYGTRKSICTGPYMMELLLRNGFKDVKRVNYRSTELGPPEITALDSRQLESYIVEGQK